MRAVLLLLASCAAFAQQPAFEVASVKLADPARRIIDFRIDPGGRLTVTNMWLAGLIYDAYDIKPFQLSGGPGWLKGERFDIEAKANGNPSDDQMMAMLRTLLEDRFKLKLHRETKEGVVYLLVVAKSGPKLTESKDKNAESFVGTRFTGSTGETITCIYLGQNASTALLASRLSATLERPVFDRTNIKGAFDFQMEFEADAVNRFDSPSIFDAIQEQLGLKLESAKGPIETLVIDHAEKPSAN